MASLAVVFDCSACGASTPAAVTGLSEPASHVPPRTREVLQQTGAVLAAMGRPSGDSVADLEHRILAREASMRLVYATCPRCGAKNPEGVAAIARERRRSLLAGCVAYALLAVGAYFAPRVALAVPVLMALGVIIVLLRRAHAKALDVARNLLVAAACAAVVFLAPRVAFVIPLLGIFEVAFRRRGGVADGRWSDAAQAIAFETPYRGGRLP